MTLFGACCQHCGQTYETTTWSPPWRCDQCYEGPKKVWVYQPAWKPSGLTRTADQIMGRAS